MLPLLRIFKSRLDLKSLLTWLVGWKFREQINVRSGTCEITRHCDIVTLSGRQCHDVTMSQCQRTWRGQKKRSWCYGRREAVLLSAWETSSFETFKTSKSGFWDFLSIKERWCGSLHLGNWRLMDLQILEVFTMLFTFIPMLCDDEQCPLSGESKIGDVSPLSWEWYILLYNIYIWSPCPEDRVQLGHF